MILPILFVLGLMALGSRIGSDAKVKETAPPPIISGYGRAHAGVIRVETPNPLGYRFRTLLRDRILAKGPVTRWLVDNAMLEAFNTGDMSTVLMLTKAFGKRRAKPTSEKQTTASEKHMPEDLPDITADGDSDNGVDGMEESESGELTELGQPSLKSPLDGVADEDWMEFVARIRTKPPGFKSDKYLGQYEQNKGRLKQLGLAEPATPEEEYEVLAKDVSAHARDSSDLIKQWSGDVVSVSGTEHPVCASGILGLLKSAGPEGARSWLRNPEDRKKFPKTTEAFLRTNGCF